MLRRRHDERENFAGPVLTDRDEKPVQPDRVTRTFKRTVRVAKLKNRDRLKFHSLRHSCGTWLASKGASERIIQEILGHSTVNVTAIYSHLQPEVMGDAMEKAFDQL